ncbi:hypothetical protein [Halalkalicoccus salilacus]|uniref:hypothetical protein n=1 Tax=Halalkalicoccus sp. GCM10025704 TaxID=3252662 RepID=UPI003624010B
MIDAYAGRALRRLRLRWVVAASVSVVVTALAYDQFVDRFATDLARRWLALSAVVLVYEFALLWRFLPETAPARSCRRRSVPRRCSRSSAACSSPFSRAFFCCLGPPSRWSGCPPRCTDWRRYWTTSTARSPG